MNRIKDFFYDKNDIIVAFIILLAAAVIIYFRIGDIMKYPETLVHSAAADQTTASVAPTETTVAPGAASDATKATTAAATKSITITQDAASTTVAKQLEKAKLVSSAKEFKAALEKYDMAGSIRSGTYQIPVGATNEKIIEIITKQKVK